ncbi:MAG: hypothetical protein V5B33_07900 [Candidatus Accumulibacter sp. UW20]|jgi:hypothetical protein
MSPRTLKHHDSEALSDLKIDNCRTSLLWSIWTLELALEALNLPVSELADEAKADPEYGQRIATIYQMLVVERAVSPVRDRIVVEMVERIRTTLMLAGLLPTGHPLDRPIDYTLIPPSGGVDADDINILRPDLRLLRG